MSILKKFAKASKRSFVCVVTTLVVFTVLFSFNSPTANAATAPGAPTNGVVTSVGNHQVSLSWTPPSDNGGAGITAYSVQVTPSCALCLGLLPLTNSPTVTGLTNGVNYTFKIFAVNLFGTSSTSLTIANVTVGTPSAVTGLAVSATANGQVGLNWTAPVDNGGSAIIEYDIVATPACTNCSGLTTTGTSTTVAGLTNGTNYSFSVAARNSTGLSLLPISIFATPASVPSPPTGLTVTSVQPNRVDLSWTPPSDNGGSLILGYAVDVSPPCPLCLGAGSLLLGNSTSVLGLTNGTTYTFKVRALNLTGYSAYSVAASATPATTPDIPTSPSVLGVGDGQVSLSWSAPSNNGGAAITGYQVQVAPACASCTGLTSTGTSTSVAGLTNGTTYIFTIRAQNAQGNGLSSLPVTATPRTVPGAPTSLTTTGTGDHSVGLSWSVPANSGGALITGYTVQITLSCSSCTGANTIGNSTTINGLTNGTNYSFAVVANNSQGSSAASAPITATPASVPSAPQSPSVTATDNGQVSLSWSAPSTNGGAAITGYSVQVSPACVGCTGLGSLGTSTTVSGLNNGINYTFTIVANNSQGASAGSTSVTGIPATEPNAPTLPIVTSTGNGQVALSWIAPLSNGGSAITGYAIDVTPACSGCTGKTPSGTSTTVAVLTNGTDYTFSIRAINAKGSSVGSNSVVATPRTAPGAPSGLTVVSSGDGQVALSWTGPGSTGGSPVTGYSVNVSPTCIICSGTTSTGTSTAISGLTNGTPYTFTVAATNAAGTGSASGSVSSTPTASTTSPTGLHVTTTGNGTVQLGWNAPISLGGGVLSNYQIAISPSCSGCTGTTPTGTSTTISGLTNGTIYAFTVSAVTNLGTGPASVSTFGIPQTSPQAPSGLTVSSVGDHQVNLSWTPPASNGGSILTGYAIDVSPACSLCLGTGSLTTSTAVAGLTNGTNYTFTVRAINLLGSSAASNAVTATPASTPSPVTGLAVTSTGDHQVGLSWSAPSSDGGAAVSGYAVDIFPTCSGCTGATPASTSTTINGLTNGVTYTFVVRAINSQGSALDSSAVIATPSTTAGAPSGLTVVSADNGQVSLAWTPPVSNGGSPITNYIVQVSPACASCTGTTSSSSSATVRGLTNGTQYTFNVVAQNSQGTSSASGSVTATPASVPGATTAVVVTGTGNGQVSMSWSSPSSNGGSSVTGYQVLVSPLCVSCSGLSPSGTSTTITGLTNGVTYTFTVIAINSHGSALTGGQASATPSDVAGSPTVLSVLGTGDGNVTLGWIPPLNNGGAAITGYNIQISPACAGCTGTATSNTSTTVSGLTNGTNYIFTAKAINSAGTSAASNSVSAIPVTSPNAPTAPAITATGDGTVGLSWTAPSSNGGAAISGYQVQVSPLCLSCTGTTPSSTATTIGGLANGTVYTFTIVAVNSRGNSAASPSVSATPSSTPGAPTNVTVSSVTNQQANLTWTAPLSDGGSPITGYVVTTSPSCSGCTGTTSTGTSTTVSGLTNGTSYVFTVRAVNARGNGASASSINTAILRTPSSPLNPTVTDSGDASVSLHWDTPIDLGGSSLGGYNVQISPSCAGCSGTSTTGNSTTITGLTNGVAYTFTVVASSILGAGPASAPIIATPSRLPDPPTSLTLMATNVGEADLTWTAPVSNGGAIVDHYLVQMTPACVACSGSTPTGTSTAITGLSSGLAYTFTVRAVNVRGQSGLSNSVTAMAPIPPTTTPPPTGGAASTNNPADGYRLVASDGGIFAYGGAKFYGSTGAIKLNQPIVGMASTPSNLGYWLVASDGGIFAYGDASFYGSTGAIKLNKPIVGMMPTPSGNGYWLVASDGGIFAYGDAQYYGSTGATTRNKPIVGMTTTPSGHGYWLVASDGGIFAYGDAAFYGSTGAMTLNKPIVSMATTSSGHGYWLVASDGGIFAYGDASFYGSTGSIKLNKPIVSMAASPTGHGYWLVASDGGIFSYGDSQFYGSTGATTLNKPIVGMGV